MQTNETDRRKATQGDEISETQRAAINEFSAEMQELLAGVEPERSRNEQTRLDQETIEDERIFIQRFGFDWPRRDRVALLELKHRCDLTDREIRLLNWTGSLRRRDGIVILISSRGAAIFGKCLIVLMCVEFLLVVGGGLLGLHHALSFMQAGRVYIALVVVIALVWGVNLGYVRPWTIQRRTPGGMRRRATGMPV